jgi:hypothetical protein
MNAIGGREGRGGAGRTALGMAGGTLAFAAVHSLLASDAVKQWVARRAGARVRAGAYRAGYNAVAIATTGALFAWGWRHPGRTLWHVRGPLALLLRAGQLAGLAVGAAAVRQIGVLRFAGAPGLVALAAGDDHVPLEPEGQGPRVADGCVPHPGPFAWTRHPLNAILLPVIWLQPHMTTTLAAFGVVTTAYLVAGSRHEEARLAARYGAAYEAYRRSGVPFLVPRLAPRPPAAARDAP